MQYQEVPKNKSTQFGIKTEPIAREYYKITQNHHHKNLAVQICGVLVKQEFSHLEQSSDFPLNTDKSFKEKHRFYFQIQLPMKVS